MSDTERLFEAFLAGFDATGEGFNGEYVGSRYRPREVLEADLRRTFEKWLADPDYLLAP